MGKRKEAIYEGSAVEKINRAGDKVFKRTDKIITEAVDEVLISKDVKATIVEELRRILGYAATREMLSDASDFLEKRVKKLGMIVGDKQLYLEELDKEIAFQKKLLAQLKKRVLTYNVMERMQGK